MSTTGGSATGRSTAVGVFENAGQAQLAVNELRQVGFSDDQIGFVARDQDREGGGDDANAGGGAATGAVTGGLIGGLLGAAAALLIPGIGPIVAGGVLASALGGAAIGATAGGLLGALAGLGVPEEEAQYYESEFASGRTIVTVQAGDRYEEAVAILRKQGGYDYTQRTPAQAGGAAGGTMAGAGMGTSGTTTTSGMVGDDDTASTRRGDAGEIGRSGGMAGGGLGAAGSTGIGGSQTFTSSELRDDDATRGGMSGGGTTGGMTATGMTGTAGMGTSGAGGTADVGMTGGGTPGAGSSITGAGAYGGGVAWDDVSTAYRSDFERTSSTAGRRWEDAEPGYRYGHELASDPNYQGRNFDEFEGNLRSDYARWAQGRGYQFTDDDDAWQRLREDIRSSWNRARSGGLYGDSGTSTGDRA